MPVSPKTLKQFKLNLRDLADKELGIRSRRRQLFDALAAECGDDDEARRAARVILYEVQREICRKRIEDNNEFLLTGEDMYDGPDDDGAGTD